MITLSNLYPDLDKTTFPEAIDQRYIMIDPSTADDLNAINSYNYFIDAKDMANAIKILAENPRLQRMMFNADKWNRHEDMIIAMQRYYESDIQDYLVNIITYKGDWSDAEPYKKYDVVIVHSPGADEAFMAIKDVPANTPPPNTEYWVAITLRGEQGASGTGLSWRGAWSQIPTYTADDCVSHNNILWAALRESVNVEPGTSDEDWEIVMQIDLDAQSLLDKLKTVDGTGSGLDADLLDGEHGTYYATREGLQEHINDGSKHFGINPTENVDGTLYRGDTVPTGTMTLKYSGYLTATRVYGSYFSDYAEYFNVSNDCLDGDVVELDMESALPNRYRRCERDMSPYVVGVVSSSHFICIGRQEHASNTPIALAGKVYINLEGDCKRGDFLVSAGDGKCRAIKPGEPPLLGAVLGQAIDDGDNTIGKVHAIVMRR